ncbi:MAG: SH3 domain-containing protein [Thermomicrobiales bacterium]|nr:SH3 domain-containing protein [Thermomicrobiales bacterium]
MRTSLASLTRTSARAALLASALLFTRVAAPAPTLAQDTTSVAPAGLAYAATDLNLRKGPGPDDAIFATVPFGAELERREGGLVNDYVPVRYQGVDGWVFALGLVATPQDLPADAPADATGDDTFVAFDGWPERVTISPLMLRAAPSLEAESLAGMPEGSVVYLTQEGYENGYITVDYGGLQGWAYADFLAEPGSE